jgi:hypothetical protein
MEEILLWTYIMVKGYLDIMNAVIVPEISYLVIGQMAFRKTGNKDRGLKNTMGDKKRVG